MTLFPALGFFDSQFLIRWQVSDHLQYLPLIAPVALAAAGLAAALPARVFRGAAAVLILVLTILSFQRAEAFATPERIIPRTRWRRIRRPGPPATIWASSWRRGRIIPGPSSNSRASLQSNPDYADAHANLAQVLALQGKFAPAEAEFQAALRLNPLDAQTHRNFAAVLGQEGKQREAVRQLQAALSLKPDLPTRLELAGLFCQEGELGQAAAQYRRALGRNPDCVEALNNLALTPGHRLGRQAAGRSGSGPAGGTRPGACRRSKGCAWRGRWRRRMRKRDVSPRPLPPRKRRCGKKPPPERRALRSCNRQLLTLYRAGKPWHGTMAKHTNQYGLGKNPP